jgi:hypothetical protein
VLWNSEISNVKVPLPHSFSLQCFLFGLQLSYATTNIAKPNISFSTCYESIFICLKLFYFLKINTVPFNTLLIHIKSQNSFNIKVSKTMIKTNAENLLLYVRLYIQLCTNSLMAAFWIYFIKIHKTQYSRQSFELKWLISVSPECQPFKA